MYNIKIKAPTSFAWKCLKPFPAAYKPPKGQGGTDIHMRSIR